VKEEKVITEKAQASEADVQKKASPRGTLYEKFIELVLKHHIHPISVHTPNGLLPVAVFFMALAVAFGFTSFEFPAFINMVFVLPVMPLVMITGYIEWQKRYKGARTTIFLTKMACAVVVLVTLVVVVTWRLINPDIASSDSPGRWVFLSIHLIMLGATGIAGHLGGKLVFGQRD
jgi:uncharacterized membrane protein